MAAEAPLDVILGYETGSKFDYGYDCERPPRSCSNTLCTPSTLHEQHELRDVPCEMLGILLTSWHGRRPEHRGLRSHFHYCRPRAFL